MEDHITNDGWIEKSDGRAQIKWHKCVTEKDRDGFCIFCVARRVGQINSSAFQKTVTSISLVMYDPDQSHRPVCVNKNTQIIKMWD